MSPSALPPPVHPQNSKVAVVVYALCGVIGVAGLFAAVNDYENGPDVVEVAVEAPVAALDARLAVGVWRNGSDVVVVDANGSGSSCLGGTTASFTWRLQGNDLKRGDDATLGTFDNGALHIGQLVLTQGGGSL